jgi:hypothetical protein
MGCCSWLSLAWGFWQVWHEGLDCWLWVHSGMFLKNDSHEIAKERSPPYAHTWYLFHPRSKNMSVHTIVLWLIFFWFVTNTPGLFGSSPALRSACWRLANLSAPWQQQGWHSGCALMDSMNSHWHPPFPSSWNPHFTPDRIMVLHDSSTGGQLNRYWYLVYSAKTRCTRKVLLRRSSSA